MSIYFYRPQRSCGQGNIFTPVCHSVHGGGGLPQCMLGYHPPGTRQTPPGLGRPPLGPGRPPPDQADPPQDQADPPGPGRPPRDQADTPPGPGRHPPGPGKLQHTVYERPVRILLECILVNSKIMSCME